MSNKKHDPSGSCGEVANDHGMTLLDAEALGRLMGLGSAEKPGSAARSIRSRISRRKPMPPAMQIPGSRKMLWHPETVMAWLKRYERPVRRGPGRPSKLDQLAMRGDG